MTKHLLTIFLAIITFSPIFSQTMNDTIYAYKTTSVNIDGQATEECWKEADWHPINQVWIPYGATLTQGDFEGRFKTAWDENFLYVLVEVVDDSLSDDHPNALDQYYNDDCVEVFIDENRSMGDHERNYNAFAYHVSLFYDAIDLGDSWREVNLKENLSVDMDTIAKDTYLWEMAFKMYDEKFSISNPEASRVYLSHNKLMGFAIAYCDNDETSSRENFIGSMIMPPPPNNNNMYKNADYFGPLLCVDQNFVSSANSIQNISEIQIYPVPTKDIINIKLNTDMSMNSEVSVISSSGIVVRKESFQSENFTINIEDLEAGIYFIQIKNREEIFGKKIIIQ